MFVFPALITPTVAIGIVIPFMLMPVVLLVFIVWQIKKLNAIEGKLKDIQENLEKANRL